MKRVLAIDLGASSGRGIIFESDGKSMNYQEIHRFDNNCQNIDGKLKWDVYNIFEEILTCIEKCKEKDIKIDSIGIDTWGVDYGVIDLDGKLKEQPYSYRDSRTSGAIEKQEICSKREAFDIAGISLNEFNTSYQLIAQQKENKIEETDTILFMPYLLAYMLTGKLCADSTMASTTAIYSNGKYDEDFLNKIGLNFSNFPPVKKVGSEIGSVKKELLESLGIDYDIKVLVTCSHDTASAIMTVMSEDSDTLYLSSGTWSLFGTLADYPIINDVTFKNNYTNELGFLDKVTLLKNIMGMWIVQECRREWNKENNYSFKDIQDLAKVTSEFKGFINVEDQLFSPPKGMDKRIVDYVLKTQNIKLEGVGEISRCIYNSLALEYRYALDSLKKITKKEYKTLYIIGGGTQNEFLNQLVANALNITVIGGCVEATAIGNALAQYYGLKVVDSLDQIQRLSRLTYTPKMYYPEGDLAKWDKAYKEYLKLK